MMSSYPIGDTLGMIQRKRSNYDDHANYEKDEDRLEVQRMRIHRNSISGRPSRWLQMPRLQCEG